MSIPDRLFTADWALTTATPCNQVAAGGAAIPSVTEIIPQSGSLVNKGDLRYHLGNEASIWDKGQVNEPGAGGDGAVGGLQEIAGDPTMGVVTTSLCCTVQE